MPKSTSKTEYALEATRHDGSRVNFGAAAAPLSELEEEIKTWSPEAKAGIVERTVTTTTTDWEPVGAVKIGPEHVLANPTGLGKVVFPDGTEITGEQFQDSVVIATESYAIGQADSLEKAMKTIKKRYNDCNAAGADLSYLDALNDAWDLLRNQLRELQRNQ